MAFKRLAALVSAAAAAVLTCNSSPALSQKRPPLAEFAPDGKWTVDYAANLCVLGRDMVSGDRKLRFSVRPSLNSPDAKIAITEKATKSRRLYGYPVVQFSDGSRASASGRQVWRDGTRWTLIGVLREDLTPLERPNSSVEIWFGDQYVRLNPGDMTKANLALATCERDLLKLMGMSEAEQEAMATPPVYPKGGILRHSDYPDTLISKDIEATMGLLIDVAADGRVTACKALESSGIAAFDTYACEIFKKRGKYGPAIDKGGNPMRALMYQSVNWYIEPNFWGTYYDKKKSSR